MGPELDASEATKAVQAFNSLYADMELALWTLSRASRKQLLLGEPSEALATLVWTIKSWWGVQGVKSDIRVLAAEALAAQEWTEDMFAPTSTFGSDQERFATGRVADVVQDLVDRGAGRREFSLASKALHWLIPWRIPVYDSFVRKSVGVPTSWDQNDAYRSIAAWSFRAAQDLSESDASWIGHVEPTAPFRGLDKYLWWLGGGSSGRAVVVKDPWRVVTALGLSVR